MSILFDCFSLYFMVALHFSGYSYEWLFYLLDGTSITYINIEMPKGLNNAYFVLVIYK
jgi:hypothetical protein